MQDHLLKKLFICFHETFLLHFCSYQAGSEKQNLGAWKMLRFCSPKIEGAQKNVFLRVHILIPCNKCTSDFWYHCSQFRNECFEIFQNGKRYGQCFWSHSLKLRADLISTRAVSARRFAVFFSKYDISDSPLEIWNESFLACVGQRHSQNLT